MKRGTLQQVRFWVPPIIFAVLYSLLANLVGLTEISVPAKPKELWFNVPLLLVGLGYYLSPLRKWINSGFHKAINENIRKRFVVIADVNDDRIRYKWAKVKNVFYRQIDNDPSLTSRSQAIMFNGALWTTAADFTIISFMFAIVCTLLYFLDFENASIAVTVFGGLSLASLLFQALITRKHIELGNDQLDFIEQYHREDVSRQMRDIANG